MAFPLRVFVFSALMAPMPAFADCAERIAALEANPDLQAPAAADGAADGANGAAEALAETAAGPGASNDASDEVNDEVVGEGKAVTEGGGETVYRESGPALPRENWLTVMPDMGAVIAHLDAAESALDVGDEKACLESVEQAEDALAEK